MAKRELPQKEKRMKRIESFTSKVLIIIGIHVMAANTYAERVDPIRAKACEDYVRSRGDGINKYTGRKYSRYTWWSIYEDQGMWKRPEFGQNYLLRFSIQMNDENGRAIGGSVSYYCVSHIDTKKVIGFELDPVQ